MEELLTKKEFLSSTENLRGEFKMDMQVFRQEVKADMREMKTELLEAINDVASAMSEFATSVDHRFNRVDERFDLVEGRLTRLETTVATLPTKAYMDDKFADEGVRYGGLIRESTEKTHALADALVAEGSLNTASASRVRAMPPFPRRASRR